MADAVRAQKFSISVHQSLHGYEDGHRLLASSVQIKGRDGKTLLSMSDVSGPNARISETGYLTGYPLPDSGFYALARTWPAPEMSRPGCVWTHTLLIDLADLALLESVSPLIGAFRRPSFPIDKNAYETLLEINTVLRLAEILAGTSERPLLAAVLSALYENADDKIVILACERWDRERWVLRIWEQQWPRLRRNFRFCTLAYADRSTQDDKFDLQVLPESDVAKARVKIAGVFVDLNSEIGDRQSPWLDVAVEDLLRDERGNLREFLRQVGGDIVNGRGAFTSLCELYSLLFLNSEDTSRLNMAVRILTERLGDQEARGVKKVVVERIIDRVAEMDDPPFLFILDNLDLIELTKMESCASVLGQVIWSRDRELFWRLLNEKGMRDMIAVRTVETLSASELIAGLGEKVTYLQRLFQVRPNIFSEIALWETSDTVVKRALEIISSNPRIAETSIAGMIRSGRRGMAWRVNQLLDHRIVLPAVTKHLDSVGPEMSETDKEWVAVCVRDVHALASHLAAEAVGAKTTLLALARATRPDDVPNDIGDDPWLIAMRAASGEVSEAGRVYLAAYLLARALGNHSRSAGELIALTFDDVYRSAARSHLPEDAWQLLEPRLPWSFFWFNWDRCQRLRSAVTDAFVNRSLSHEAYIRLTRDEELFQELTTLINSTWRGRNYLSAVRKTLEGSTDDLTTRRVRMINKTLLS